MYSVESKGKEIERLVQSGRTTEVVDGLNELAWDIRKSDLQNAYKASTIGEEIATEINYKQGVSDALKTQAYCLWRFSDYPGSMDKSTKALKIAEELQDLKGQADILNTIGAVYMFLKDNENRLKCNLKCLDIRNQVNDWDGVSGSLNNIGETYYEMGDYDKAEEYFEKCLGYEKSTDDSIAWALHNLGLLYKKRGEEKKSEQYLLDSIEVAERINYDVLVCTNYRELAKVYLENKRYTEANKVLNKACVLAETMGSVEELQNVHLVFSRLYESQGMLEEALIHYKKYNKYHLELYNEQNSAIISNLKNQFEVESLQKEAEIERLKNIELKKAFMEIDAQKN